MKRLTLNQSKVLSNPGVTTCLRAARHLADLGLIEIKRELRGWYTGEVRALEFVVTERGRERLELAKSIRPYDRSRNQKVYERHERGEVVHCNRAESRHRSVIGAWAGSDVEEIQGWCE